MHSPTPWTFIVEDSGAAEIIQDAKGNSVHYDTTYYPSGMRTDDAIHIVACVNRVAELEAALRPFARVDVRGLNQVTVTIQVADINEARRVLRSSNNSALEGSEEAWDNQIASDDKAGKLNERAQRALDNLQAGRVRDV